MSDQDVSSNNDNANVDAVDAAQVKNEDEEECVACGSIIGVGGSCVFCDGVMF